MKELDYGQLSHNGLTIEGYSRAAMQTFWRISEMKLGFDVGAQPWEFMGTPRIFISHTHLDHILTLPAYVARRRMMKMSPPTIYVPMEAASAVQQYLAAAARLDRGKLPCSLVGVEPGDEIELSRELVVSVHQTFHSVSSVGYVVWERRKKLKDEFTSLTGEQIRDLAKAGENISYEIRFPKVAYLGDSTAKGLDANPDMLKAEILILELTFVAPEHKKEALSKFGHIHLDDIVERKNIFQNELVIASHFSTRYQNWQIEQAIKQRLPEMLDGRLKLWLD